MKENLRVAFIVSECVPFVKTGGLADVAGALPQALTQFGCETRVFLPLYKSISTKIYNLKFRDDLAGLSVRIADRDVPFYLWQGFLPDSETQFYFIESAAYFHRDTVYTDDDDEADRFILLQLAVLQTLKQMAWQPDILHCNDWQSALVPALLKEHFANDPFFIKTATVFSIHNIAYQGQFPLNTIGKAGLDIRKSGPGDTYEFEEHFNFMKTGLETADVLNTVSASYAREIQTHEFGAGLENILAKRKKDLFGILNGIDKKEWNPRTDTFIEERYSLSSLRKKRANKQQILVETRMPFEDEFPVIGMVTRLAGQKGVELLQPIMGKIMELPLHMIVLGSGDPRLEQFLQDTMKTYPEKFWAYICYNNRLAHLITAGSDMFLMPSRYEPCGLNQMYSLNYGTIPIVRKTGGLADTVRDYHEFNGSGTGFSFDEFTARALLDTIHRALDVFNLKKEWMDMVRRGMRMDFSWQSSAEKYRDLYDFALQKKIKME